MANFPEGKFTITNNDTGRSVRAILGKSHADKDYQLGNTYTTYTTADPRLGLGELDGIEYAWNFHTAYNQIRSVAVDEKQNIGSYCVAVRVDSDADHAAQLVAVMPPEWTHGKLDWVHTFDQVAELLHRYDEDEARRQWEEEAMLFGRPAEDSNTMFDEVKAVVERLREEPADRARVWADCPMTLEGATGIRRFSDGWQTDGAYIWKADDAPATARTYWTDANGTLVGRAKGDSNQTWTFKPA